MPITTSTDTVVGSISIAGPSHRMSKDHIVSDLEPLLMEAVNVIELDLTVPNVQR